MIEIERKFRLSSEKMIEVEQILKARHGVLKSVHQSDQVFLQGIDSFKNFKRGMPVIRLRTMDGITELAYKRAINDKGDSLEHELEVGSAETMQRILEEIGYRQVTLIVKDRIEIKEAGLTLALDKVDRLGDFLEIEVLANEDNQEAEKTILRKAAEFGLTTEDVEPKKYDQLLEALTS